MYKYEVRLTSAHQLAHNTKGEEVFIPNLIRYSQYEIEKRQTTKYFIVAFSALVQPLGDQKSISFYRSVSWLRQAS